MGVHVKVDGAWQEIGVDGASGVPWAKVTGGTVTEYTKPDGAVMEVHTLANGQTLTVDTPGYAEFLILAGRSGPAPGDASWNAGALTTGLGMFPAGGHAVVVGVDGNPGGYSRIGSLFGAARNSAQNSQGWLGAGYWIPGIASQNDGVVSSITGTPVEYGHVNAADGKVIVAVQKSPTQ